MNLADIRKSKGMTQEQTAELAGVTRPYLAKLEGGYYNPSVDVVIKIAAALGVTEQEIINGLKLG